MEFNKSSNIGSDTDQSDDNSKAELLLQITSLQDAVSDMKIAITNAAEQLGTLQWDESSCLKKIDQNKNECQNQIAEVVKLILSLQTEFGSVKYQLQQLQEAQSRNQHQLQGLLLDQDLLIEELRKTSSISESFRQQFNYCRQLRTSTGSQSNDSGVALLLEKAQSGFHHFSFPTPSDHDSVSIPETSPGVVSSMVQEYIAGLNQSVNINWDEDDARYDSDSSLVAAANKSLSLSTSLGKQCYLEFYHQDHSDVEDHSLECDVENMTQENRNQNSQLLKSEAVSLQGVAGKNQMNFLHKKQPYPSLSKAKSQVQEQHLRESKSAHRLQLSKSIIEAERKYCKKLWILQDTYMEPLKEQGILSLKDFNTLFPEEIYRLYEKHCMLLHKLEERIQAWKWQSIIGDILLKFTDPEETDVLNLYTSYVNEFPEVLKMFHKLCRQSDRFTKFLKDSSKNSGGNSLDLTDFLLTPLQRIPKYVLFLKHILKFTTLDHSDYSNITICLNRLRDFLVRLNDSMEHSFQLITAQINSQSDYDSCLSPSLNYQEKMSRDLKNRYRKMDSQELIGSSDEENSLQEELIQPKIKQNKSNCQEKEVVHYKKCIKTCKGKNCGSQESLKPYKQSKFYVDHQLNPMNSCSSLMPGSCCEKLHSRPKSEIFITGSASCSDVFDTCKNNAHEELKSQSLSKMCVEEENSHTARNDSGYANNHNKYCLHAKHSAYSTESCTRSCTDSNSGILQYVEEEDDDIASEKICEKFINTNFSILSSLSESQSISSSSTSKSLQDLKEDLGHLKNKTSANTEEEKNFAEIIKLNKCSRNYIEAEKKGTKKADSHHSSNVDLTSSKHLDVIRPLSKAHSSHAVMQMLKDQSNADCSLVSENYDCDRKKGNCKTEKKKVSLRSLKNMFFKKRAYANVMKTMDIGTCTSHDDIPSSDNLLKPTAITSDASA